LKERYVCVLIKEENQTTPSPYWPSRTHAPKTFAWLITGLLEASRSVIGASFTACVQFVLSLNFAFAFHHFTLMLLLAMYRTEVALNTWNLFPGETLYDLIRLSRPCWNQIISTTGGVYSFRKSLWKLQNNQQN